MQHAGKVVTSQDRQKPERVGRSPQRRSFNLREKLREFYRQEVRAELRAVASLNNVELITALISCNRQLGLVGLQLRILNGVVSLLTTEVHNKALAQYLSQQRGAIGSLDLTTATLEVLACIAFKATPNLFGVRPLLAGRLCTATFAGFTRAYASRTL